MAHNAQSITSRQTHLCARRLQTAARHEYANAIRLRRLQTWPSFVFAGAGPILVLIRPESQTLLAAAAGGWLFLSRIVLAPHVAKQLQRGARALEQFDCYVFGLTWNNALGEPLAPEEIVGSSAKSKYLGAWYPEIPSAQRTSAILICQRSNVVWSRRQHATYAGLITALASIWLAFGILIAILRSVSLEVYLITVGLPSAPALLDAIETRRANRETALRRLELEGTLDAAITAAKSRPPDEQLLRSMQDQVFEFRKSSPLIPEALYKWLRPRYNVGMAAAAEMQSRKE